MKGYICSVAAEFEWKPPTNAEMKVLQARRERQDKISKIMGEYLLKGYKMMGTVCSECQVGNQNVLAVCAHYQMGSHNALGIRS